MTIGKTTWIYAVVLSLLILPAVFSFPVLASWVENGIVVCGLEGDQWYPKIVPDGEDGGILIWQDYRSGAGNVFLQRMTGGGAVSWTAGGLPASSEPGEREFFRQAASDGVGGAVVVWMDHRGGSIDIYCQRVTHDGAAIWQSGGTAVAVSAADEYYPTAVGDGSGGIFVAWQAGEEGSSAVIAQRVGGEGDLMWDAQGVAVSGQTGVYYPAITADGEGGAIVFWVSGGESGTEVRAQRISVQGEAQWGTDGALVCSACEVHTFMDACADGAGGAIAVWQDLRNGNHDIYAQRIDRYGNVLWTDEGVAAAAGPRDQWLPSAAAAPDGGAVIAWMDAAPGDHDIWAQRIYGSGALSWGDQGVAVAAAAGQQLNPRAAVNAGGETIVVWQDGRSGDYDIYAQKIDPSGIAQWNEGGLPVSVSAGDQRLPELVTDSAGGALITWEEWGSQSDISCQRISSSGAYLAISLASHSSRVMAGAVELEWVMAEIEPGLGFAVSRRKAGDPVFISIEGAAIDFEDPVYRFTDTSVESGEAYLYMVESVSGKGRKVLFEAGPLMVPAAALAVYQNHPNPFNPVTMIRYRLPARSRVEIFIFGVSGRRVASIGGGIQDAGEHTVLWNGTDDLGRSAASGVYFYRVRAGKETETRKMVLMR